MWGTGRRQERQGDLVHCKPESSPFHKILQSLVNQESWSTWGKGRVLWTLWGRGEERETVPDNTIHTDIADSDWQTPPITMAFNIDGVLGQTLARVYLLPSD